MRLILTLAALFAVGALASPFIGRWLRRRSEAYPIPPDPPSAVRLVEPPVDTLTARLYATTDGMVWATEFCKLFLVLDRKDGTTLDEGTMVSWFANAIEIGRDAGRAAVVEPYDWGKGDD